MANELNNICNELAESVFDATDEQLRKEVEADGDAFEEIAKRTRDQIKKAVK
jgi:hypothetical protein